MEGVVEGLRSGRGKGGEEMEVRVEEQGSGYLARQLDPPDLDHA